MQVQETLKLLKYLPRFHYTNILVKIKQLDETWN